MNIHEVVYSVYRYFGERNIPMDGLTIIINLTDKNAAARLDSELKKEIAPYMPSDEQNKIDIRTLKIRGISVKIESPLHQPIKDA